MTRRPAVGRCATTPGEDAAVPVALRETTQVS
jgi:hypothetical protein